MKITLETQALHSKQAAIAGAILRAENIMLCHALEYERWQMSNSFKKAEMLSHHHSRIVADSNVSLRLKAAYSSNQNLLP